MPAANIQITLSPATKKYLSYAIKNFTKARVYEFLDKLFDKIGLLVAGHISRTKLAGQKLKIRTGALSKSVVGGGVRVQGVPAIRVGILRGPALGYAGVQEFGTKTHNPNSPYADITPRKAKALAMPVNSSLTASGVARYRGPREDPRRLSFIPFRRGIAVGALYPESELRKLKRSRGKLTLKDLKAAYILLRKVALKPVFFLRDGFTEMMPTISVRIGEGLKQFIEGQVKSS